MEKTYQAARQNAEKMRQLYEHQYELAQTKQQAGMATQAEADYRSADLALVQAMDTYEWAVLGIADVE